jgi:NAD(P)-dependent dehydrogenase (short-subunit alcohol dehydrogenase family)
MAQQPNLAGKVAIVTGGSSGIGQYTALGLAKLGATVVITARHAARLSETAGWIARQVPGAAIETEPVDFASFASVRDLAARIIARQKEIAILVNNAGMITARREVTEDGHEKLFQVNHLAPFLLTHLLLPALAAPARIVIVASRSAQRVTPDPDDLETSKGWLPMKAYGRSKLGNIMFAFALARRLEGAGIPVNALHPGFVGSRIGNKGGIVSLGWNVLKPFIMSEEEGAETSLYAATAPEMANVTGQYLVAKKPARANPIAYDVEAQEHLWRVSAGMVGIAA